jgi:tetratricopeptide (TPR) repeat protein
MKRNLSLWLGLAAIALLPAVAQNPGAKIHGHVTNPVGTPTTKGSVSLTTATQADGPGLTSKQSEKYTFPVSETGEYQGDVAPGNYTVIFRDVDTPHDKIVDEIDGVKILAGQDALVDIDMSRPAYIEKLSPDKKKELEEIKKKNESVLKTNAVIKALNADILAVNQDLKDADAAHSQAVKELGATALPADVKAKEEEIRTAKYTEIETIMLKDTGMRPNEPILWLDLAQAQAGLKKYDDAEPSFKKALDLDSKDPKKLNPSIEGGGNSGLGAVYARTGKVPEANAAFDAAAKANPAAAGTYLKNEAVIFYQLNNGDAQVAAAEEAITADPTQAIAYYLKGQGLVQKATIDPKTNKIVAPPGCLEAYQKYLELAPDGPYATEVKGVLEGFGQKIVTSYKAGKK